VGNWEWRMDEDVKGSRTRGMKLRSYEGGWICSRMEGAMLHKNVEIRPNSKNVANEGKESWIRS